MIDISAHRVIVLGEEIAIAVILIGIPDDQMIAAAPRRRPFAVGKRPRGDVGEIAVFLALSGLYIPQPLAIKLGHVEVIHRLLGRHMGVADPSQTFVPLRAIRGQAHQVCALRPQDRTADGVDPFTAAAECAGRLDAGMDHVSFHLLFSQFSGIAADLGVAKAMIGETWLINLLLSAFHNVHVSGCSQVVGPGVDPAVGRHSLCITNGHLLIFAPLETDPQPPGKILPHIHDLNSRLRLADAKGLQLFGDSDGRQKTRDQPAAGRRQHRCRHPAAVVKVRRSPAGNLLIGVIDLAVIDAAAQYRAVRCFPTRIRTQHLRAAVLKNDDKLEQRPFGPIPLHAPGPPFGQRIEPAVAQHQRQGVCTGSYLCADIIGVVQHHLFVERLGRSQHLIADLFSVHIQLIVAEP
ncbi:MAG: hypothetical protein BWY83_02350 [bacterium ADurb.Bin478]|nr:MAG: hypothetical protein BWY83_02350 [bacterium ADurb.Bin478]